jgi:hypothetical protein
MIDQTFVVDALEERARRREERRGFFKAIGGAAAIVGTAAVAIGGLPRMAAAQAAPSDSDVLNFALNLEYLEAQFYLFAVSGAGLPNTLLDGAGTRGQVRGGRQVPFTDPVVADYAREIAADERAHVEFLRTALASAVVAQPAIDISGDANGPFTAAARAAGLIGAGETFDPYFSDENFLLGAYIFEDVGVTAYKGAATLITNKTFLEAAAGILAVEAYHAANIRTTLFRKGMEMPRLIDATESISDARDQLAEAADTDQGIRPMNDASNIAPLDANGLAFGRPAADVLNIVYLTQAAATAGGFFPNGVNGTIRTSSAFA